jgi:hypothetical protein
LSNERLSSEMETAASRLGATTVPAVSGLCRRLRIWRAASPARHQRMATTRTDGEALPASSLRSAKWRQRRAASAKPRWIAGSRHARALRAHSAALCRYSSDSFCICTRSHRSPPPQRDSSHDCSLAGQAHQVKDARISRKPLIQFAAIAVERTAYASAMVTALPQATVLAAPLRSRVCGLWPPSSTRHARGRRSVVKARAGP